MDDTFNIMDSIKHVKQDRLNCIYLIYLSSIGQEGKNIYKFGRTYDPAHRFFQYPKNSTLIFICRVKDCFFVEDEIYKLFLKSFVQADTYGREYFECNNVNNMIKYINILIDHMNQRLDDNMITLVKKCYKNWLKFKIYDTDDIPINFSNELIQDYMDDKIDYTLDKNKRLNIYKKCIKTDFGINNIGLNIKDTTLTETILYNKDEDLSNTDKLLKTIYNNRCTFLGINYDKKVEKKKNKNYIIDDEEFKKIYILSILHNKNIIDNKTALCMKKDYNISNSKTLIEKIKIIMELEKSLNINSIDIDTKRDMDRFNEDIEITDEFKKLVRKLFRFVATDDISYGFWYYRLIQMYKNILGCDIFLLKKVEINGNRHQKYTTNDAIMDKYLTFL
jgi:hypothetical protein